MFEETINENNTFTIEPENDGNDVDKMLFYKPLRAICSGVERIFIREVIGSKATKIKLKINH